MLGPICNNALMYKLSPRQAQFMTTLSFDLQVWPGPSTYINKCFERHLLLEEQQLCKIILISMHKCTTYGLDKLNLWPFWPLFDPYDLDLQPTWKNVSNGTSPSRGQQLCKIILKSMHKCTSYGPDKFNIWPFWPLFDPCDLDLQPTWKMFQMELLLLEDNNCAELFWNPCINVQAMAQTSSIYDHFDLYLTPVTLTFNLPEKMFQMALLLLKGNNCANFFKIHAYM